MTILKQTGATALRLTDISLMPHICAIADSIYMDLLEIGGNDDKTNIKGLLGYPQLRLA